MQKNKMTGSCLRCPRTLCTWIVSIFFPVIVAVSVHGMWQYCEVFCGWQVQHVFAVLGKTAGGARGAAMASLKGGYEKHHKYTGKV